MPHHLLDDPAFVRALRERDFTVVFALVHAAGVSFNRIAEACALKAERVSQIARGTGSVTALATVERIAVGLRIPGAFLGLAAQPWEDTAVLSTESRHGDDPMKRRNLLRGALAAGLTAPALAALTAARTDVDQTLSPDAPPQDLADLEAAAESYGYGYHGQAPTRVLADLVTDFTTLRPMLAVPQPAPVRAKLCRTAGQMAGMTAIVLHDLGSRQQSRAWFATAARAAAESDDNQLYAWVRAREAMVPLNYGAPKTAADIADQARRAAGTRPTVASTLAAAVAARAYALNHQSEQARAALTAADALMDRLPEEQRSDTWLTYGEQKHHVHLSHAFIALGDTRRARESQQRALELSAPTSTMTRTLLHIDGRGVCSPRRRQRRSLPPYGHRADRAARRLPHRPGPPPRPGPVRSDPRPAPPRTRRMRTARRPRGLNNGPPNCHAGSHRHDGGTARALSENPYRVLQWLRRSPAARLLERLVLDPGALNHESLDTLPQRAGTAYVRGLLVTASILPPRDENLALLTNWVARTVAELPARHANLIRPFAEWHIIRDARRRSARGRYTYAAHKGDCGNVLAAIDFLNWLDSQHLSLRRLQQPHLDIWATDRPTLRSRSIPFLRWSTARRLCPPGLSIEHPT
ncbi:hypothetical protein, partial [Streptomyces sp. NPDC056948]|uniref:hypothetical protein n=1 Tax=Streptomyces sp. NPDC056948 TaxID=3345975 RepID=UPI0036409538